MAWERVYTPIKTIPVVLHGAGGFGVFGVAFFAKQSIPTIGGTWLLEKSLFNPP